MSRSSSGRQQSPVCLPPPLSVVARHILLNDVNAAPSLSHGAPGWHALKPRHHLTISQPAALIELSNSQYTLANRANRAKSLGGVFVKDKSIYQTRAKCSKGHTLISLILGRPLPPPTSLVYVALHVELAEPPNAHVQTRTAAPVPQFFEFSPPPPSIVLLCLRPPAAYVAFRALATSFSPRDAFSSLVEGQIRDVDAGHLEREHDAIPKPLAQ